MHRVGVKRSKLIIMREYFIDRFVYLLCDLFLQFFKETYQQALLPRVMLLEVLEWLDHKSLCLGFYLEHSVANKVRSDSCFRKTTLFSVISKTLISNSLIYIFCSLFLCLCMYLCMNWEYHVSKSKYNSQQMVTFIFIKQQFKNSLNIFKRKEKTKYNCIIIILHQA